MILGSGAWRNRLAGRPAAGVILCLLASDGACRALSPDKIDSGGYTPLMRAAERGDLDAIRRLVRRGADLQYQGVEHKSYSILFPFVNVEWRGVPLECMTPLMAAARAGRADSAQALLDAGADVNFAAARHCLGLSAGRTATWVAVDADQLRVLKVLLARGVRSPTGNPPALVMAIERGTRDAALLLVQAKVDIASHAGGRALVLTAQAGDAELLSQLVQAGAPVEGKAGNEALLAAADRGSADSVRVLLRAGIHPDATGIPVGYTALGLAARGGHDSVVGALIEARGSVDARQPGVGRGPARPRSDQRQRPALDAATPLIFAAERGHVDVVRTLLRAGADVKARDHLGFTALSHATRIGRDDVAALLVAAGARATEQFDSDVLRAAKAGSSETLTELIRKGADMNVRDAHDGRPPMLLVALLGRADLVRLLGRGGADANARDFSGQDALTLAVVSGRLDTVEALLDVGARPSPDALMLATARHRDDMLRLLAPAAASGDTAAAFAVAAREGRMDALRVLLGTKPAPETLVEALTEAGRGGRVEAAKVLIDARADVNGRHQGVTPLIAAVQSGRADVVRLLIARGADVNARFTGHAQMNRERFPYRGEGWNALHWSACKGTAEVVGALIEGGADVHVTTSRDLTPLRCAIFQEQAEHDRLLRAAGARDSMTVRGRALVKAAEKGDVGRVRELLAERTDVNSRDEHDHTALIQAANYGRIEVVRLLLAARPDVNARSKTGATAYYCADQMGHREIARLLVQAGADPRIEPSYAAR